MDKDRERKDEPVATKPNERDKKLTDLTAGKKDTDVKGGAGSVNSSGGGECGNER